MRRTHKKFYWDADESFRLVKFLRTKAAVAFPESFKNATGLPKNSKSKKKKMVDELPNTTTCHPYASNCYFLYTIEYMWVVHCVCILLSFFSFTGSK